ncbi:hypothetical protein PIIN_03662 [Serendipita indica DSM 11827]|uniref:Uncharacterized protein n=1 Tax=Serendipita indica (strain DSM 11827) TaxID=1109443 RepID=G4TEH8_SERID|nr:hypothetical protein PIIN_03662 [Serendipita indica DSM 11827]
MRRMLYASSATQSTDDEEGMSGSESSNGTGWEHPQFSQERSSVHIPQDQHGYLQPTSQPPANGTGYSLPPLSAILGDAPLRFSSPSMRPAVPSPDDQHVKYAQFANAGPPASYGPQWGFQMPTSMPYHVQYASFHSPSRGTRSASMQPRQHSSLPHSAYDSHPHHRPHLHHAPGAVAPHAYY